MTKLTLKASERRIFGRKVRQLRSTGKIPANVFGPKTKSKAVTLDKKELLSLFKDSGETSLVDLVIEGEKTPRPVLITNMHLNPVSNELLHVDLHQVDLTSKTTANIPVVTKGEAPAVEQGGILVILLNEIEVEALPVDLPEKFELDLATLKEIGDSIHAKDLLVDSSKVEVKVGSEEPIVTIQAAKEEEPEPVVEVEEDVGEGEDEDQDSDGTKEGEEVVEEGDAPKEDPKEAGESKAPKNKKEDK